MIRRNNIFYSLIIVLLTAIITSQTCYAIKAEELKEEKLEEFEISQGILKKYNGKDSECSIPTGITEIGPEAFKNSNITYITIPSEVERVDRCAFYNCKKLKQVNIRDGVTYIGPSAFGECISLDTINIPSTTSIIGAGIFSGCTALADVTISSMNENYIVNDGVIYDKHLTRVIQYLPGRKSTSFELPDSVKSIDRYAFWGAKILTDVELNDSITEIPDHAFSNCLGLTYIYLPESVEKIRNFAFSDCKNLTIAMIENEEAKVAPTAFSGCNKNLISGNEVYTDESLDVILNEDESDSASFNEDSQDNSLSDNTINSKVDKPTPSVSNTPSTPSNSKIRDGVIKNGKVKFDDLPKSNNNNAKIYGNIIGESKISGQHVLIIPR